METHSTSRGLVRSIARQFAAILFFLALASKNLPQEYGQIPAGLLTSVVEIKSPIISGTRSAGTGFLASPSLDASGRIFLVTNKHMIGKWICPGDDLTEIYDWIDVYFYRQGDPEGRIFTDTRIKLKDSSGQLDRKKVFVHDDKTVDVVAIDVDEILRKPELHIGSAVSVISASYMVRFDAIDKQLTGIGDLVFALGYPRGISSLLTNHPIAKAGYLASVPGEEMAVPTVCSNQNGGTHFVSVKGKILVVDGLITHGNSGGPVLLGGGIKIRHDPKTGLIQHSSIDVKNLVCGIVSFEIRGPDLQPGSGLTAVYSADYIWDLLDKVSKQIN